MSPPPVLGGVAGTLGAGAEPFALSWPPAEPPPCLSPRSPPPLPPVSAEGAAEGAGVAAASCPEAALRGAPAAAPPPPPVVGKGAAGFSSMLPPLEEIPAAEGQTLNETTPTRVTKTIAAPARSPP